jgi:hypothetical protein
VIERIREQRVIYDAQTQTDHWSNENAIYRAFLDNADTGVANDAIRWRGNEAAEAEATTNTDGSSQRRESANNAAELLAETAGVPERINTALSIN